MVAFIFFFPLDPEKFFLRRSSFIFRCDGVFLSDLP